MVNTIKNLFSNGTIRLAMLPDANDYLLRDDVLKKIAQGDLKRTELSGGVNDLDLTKIDKLDGLVLTLIKKDYPAISPKMWNAVYHEIEQQHGKHFQRVFAVGQPDEQTIRAFLEAVRDDPICVGGGAGAGFKDKIIPFFADYGALHPLTKKIGAANVIHKENGKLVGYNSDGEGFVDGLMTQLSEHKKTIAGSKIVILGAGGTSAAIAFTLLEYNPREILIINRTVENAEKIVERINDYYTTKKVHAVGEDALKNALFDADAIINTSDKGGEGYLSKYSAFGPVSTDETGHIVEQKFESDLEIALANMHHVQKSALIADVNLTKELPTTLQYAKAAGYNNLQDGLEMVARQAIIQFEQRHPGMLDAKTVKDIMFKQAGIYGRHDS